LQNHRLVSPVAIHAPVETGAFAFAPHSADSALLLSLSPGRYTAEVSSPDNTTGPALIEIYELP
jgi:hypothetical protein